MHKDENVSDSTMTFWVSLSELAPPSGDVVVSRAKLAQMAGDSWERAAEHLTELIYHKRIRVLKQRSATGLWLWVQRFRDVREILESYRP